MAHENGLDVPVEDEVYLSRPRARSFNAPPHEQQFGPCGRIMKNSAMIMTVQDPASITLTWDKQPQTVLIIKKIHDKTIAHNFIQIVKWIVQEKNMTVFVEEQELNDPFIVSNDEFRSLEQNLRIFKNGQDDLSNKVDFIICMGGDGTLLYASSIFQQSVPPLMAFHLGSLGFLAPFNFNDFQNQVNKVLKGDIPLILRSRLNCRITNGKNTQDIMMKRNLTVLNEVVIDRGPSANLSMIDLFLDDKKITTVQGDGLIISTPTGSTAYAVAAGASMIHPSVQAIMVTPICPHSLSFRPIIVPAGVELKVSIPKDSRNTAYVSFDGRERQELQREDVLKVTTSIYPIPSVCCEDQIADWFSSLNNCLRWNDRKQQIGLDDYGDQYETN